MDPISALMSLAAGWGVAGLLGVILLERVVPVLPSYGLLVAVGIATGRGAWSVPTALIVSTAGGVAGCLAFYAVAMALGEARSAVLLKWTARLFGLPPSRIERLTGYFRTHQRALAFGSQLVPTVRLVAPAIAGLLRAEATTFALASACGIALWNGLFIMVGYAAAITAVATNVSTLALWILVLLVAGESLAFALWRRLRRRMVASAQSRIAALKTED
jgi:membrane protein DedA with SNARE-associated domain